MRYLRAACADCGGAAARRGPLSKPIPLVNLRNSVISFPGALVPRGYYCPFSPNDLARFDQAEPTPCPGTNSLEDSVRRTLAAHIEALRRHPGSLFYHWALVAWHQ